MSYITFFAFRHINAKVKVELLRIAREVVVREKNKCGDKKSRWVSMEKCHCHIAQA